MAIKRETEVTSLGRREKKENEETKEPENQKMFRPQNALCETECKRAKIWNSDI